MGVVLVMTILLWILLSLFLASITVLGLASYAAYRTIRFAQALDVEPESAFTSTQV